jgi:hypothetical protein
MKLMTSVINKVRVGKTNKQTKVCGCKVQGVAAPRQQGRNDQTQETSVWLLLAQCARDQEAMFMQCGSRMVSNWKAWLSTSSQDEIRFRFCAKSKNKVKET